jgi:hypothetical protein
MAGKPPNPGTPKDGRLKGNRRGGKATKAAAPKPKPKGGK